MSKQPENRAARPIRRRWLRRLLFGIIALSLVVIALLGLATTGPVLRLAMPRIDRAVSAAIGGKLETGMVRGSLWTGLTVDRLTLGIESTGLQVDVSRLELMWSPLALLGGIVQVDRLAAGSLSVVLPRTGAEKAPAEKASEGGPLALPLSVRLGQLDLPQFRLVDPASGREFSYKIEASGAAGENLSADLTLALLPLEGDLDRLRASLKFNAEKQELAAEIDGHFDRTGMVMTLAGLRPEDAADVTVSLKGSGPADRWQGDLDFGADGLAELSGKIGVKLDGEQIGFTFSGAAGTLGSLAEKLPAPVRGAIDIDLAGQFDTGKNRLAFSKLDLAKPGLLTSSTSGYLDLSASRLVADLQAKIDAAASGLIEDAVQWQGLELRAHAEGGLAMPDLTLTVNGLSVVTPVSTIGDVSLAFRMAAKGDRSGDRFAATVKGTALGNDWTADDLDAMLGDRLDVAMNVDIAGNFGEIVVDELVVSTAGMKLTGGAELDSRGQVAAANLQADVADLSIFSAISGLDLSGAGRVAVSNVVWGAENNNGGRADIEITADQLGLGQEDLNRLVGWQPVLTAQVQLSPQLDLEIRLNRLETAMAKGAGSIDIVDEFKKINVNCELTVQPGAIPPAIGVALPQAAHLNAKLDGPLTAPAGDIRLTVPALEAGGEKFDKLELATALTWSDNAVLSLRNRADFALRDKPYRLRLDAVLPPDRVQLDLALSGTALDLTGQLELPGYQPPMSGAITLSRLDAGLLGDWGAPIAAGQIKAKIDFVPDKGKQRIDLDAVAQDLRLAGVGGANPDSLDRLAATGHIADAFGEPVFEARLDSGRIVAGQAAVERLQATLRGALAQMRATVEAQGQFKERLPVTLAASADLALAGDIRLAVDRLNVGIGTERIALRKPLHLTRAATGQLAADAALAVGAGRLDAHVRLVPDREFEAGADLRNIALGPWGEMFALEGMTGTLSLTATLNEQAGKAPRAQFDADLSDIRVAHAAYAAQMPPMRLQLDGTLKEGGVNGHLSLGRPDLQMIKADAAVPLALSILKGVGEVDRAAPISAHADIDGEIGQFWPYVPLPDHALAGQVKLSAALSGSLANPVWEGVLNLQNGRYEHLQFGTLLRNIRIDGRFDRRGLRISEIAADDGAKGRLTGKADVELGEKEKPALAYRAEVTMRSMALTRMDELRIRADVDLNVTGDASAAHIKSEVTVQRGEVDLAVALPASVSQLDVANLPKPDQKEEEEKAGTTAFAAELNATVNIPGRLFVRGKGLDSEWGGRLDITGQADNPKIVGDLHARRGQLDVIDKPFAIRDSKITFAGEQPPDPLLEIVGVHTADDLSVTASLSGPVSTAKLTLSSEPDLPQDEILSRILFGKSQGNLTTVEAIQLARVAAEMSGEGGGLDVVGSFRRFLSADVLRVEGGEGGPNVEVGKYLTKGIYVGTKQGTTPDSRGVEVEIEVTPHLKMTSESTEVDNKAGVQFKWDY